MKATHSVGYLRFLISLAALGLLAVFLLFPDQAQAQAQTAPTIAEDDGVIVVPEGTTTSTVLHTYVATDPDANTTFTWTLEGTDAGAFNIVTNSNGEGELSFRNVPDYESPDDSGGNSIYYVTVKVSNGSMSDTQAVQVDVSNVDEPGTVTISGTLSEGVQLTAAVTDEDGQVIPASERWQWARGGSATGTFTDIIGATSAGYTTVAADVGMYLQASVDYTDRHHPGKTAKAVTSGAVEAGNSQPTFNSNTAFRRHLPENSAPGVSVGDPFTATDDDDDDGLTYGLTGMDAGSFEIDSKGQLKTKTGVTHNFDFESMKKSYAVTVTVHDGKDFAGNPDTTIDASIDVTIDLTNVNEAPSVTGTSNKSEGENRAVSTPIGNYTAADPDASSTFTWTLEGDDADDFKINPQGELRLLSSPDYESPTDSDNNNDYNVTVKVTDNGGLSATADFALTINNVNEAPRIVTGTTGAASEENRLATELIGQYRAEDPDASTTLTWSLEGDDANFFTITKIINTEGEDEGELRFRVSPNYEMPEDANGDNMYKVTVRVSDGSLSDTWESTYLCHQRQ